MQWWKHSSETSPATNEQPVKLGPLRVQVHEEDPGAGWTLVKSKKQPKTDKNAHRRPSPGLKTTDPRQAISNNSRTHQNSYAEMTRRNGMCNIRRNSSCQTFQPGWKATPPPDNLIFDLVTSPRLMREWTERQHRNPKRVQKPRLTPRVPLHCLVTPIFDKPKPKPRRKGRDRTVTSYQASPRRVKKSQSHPCSSCVRNAFKMRQLGLPGKDFDVYNREFLQAYEDGISSSSSKSHDSRPGKTRNEFKVRLPKISSNRSGFPRQSVSAVPVHSTKKRTASLSTGCSSPRWPGARALRAQ